MVVTPFSSQSFDGSNGPGFPYNIPRSSVPPKQPSQKVVGDSVEYKVENEAAKFQELPKEERKNIGSFTLRPIKNTGRIVYKDSEPRKKGYGFTTDTALDIGDLSQNEAMMLKRSLKMWLKETKYRSQYAEMRPFNKLVQAQITGFFLGFVGCYKLPSYTNPSLPKKWILANAFLGACASSYGFKTWIQPAVYIEMLQKNTPIGFKLRQFLHEHRSRLGDNQEKEAEYSDTIS